MDVTHSGSSDKQVLDGFQVRIFGFVDGGNVVQLQVQILVDGLQGPFDFYVIFELHDDLLVNKSLEETEEQHWMELAFDVTVSGISFQKSVEGRKECTLLGAKVEPARMNSSRESVALEGELEKR